MREISDFVGAEAAEKVSKAAVNAVRSQKDGVNAYKMMGMMFMRLILMLQ